MKRKTFVPGEVVDKLKIGEDEFVLSCPKRSDIKPMLNFINSVIRSRAYITYQKPLTMKTERTFLSQVMDKLKKNDAVFLVLESGGKIAATVMVDRDRGEGSEHVGLFGISMRKEFRGKGIGKKISRTALSLAKKRMKIKISRLTVVLKNKPAIRLYRRLGFKKTGITPKGFKHYGKYVDEMLMHKEL